MKKILVALCLASFPLLLSAQRLSHSQWVKLKRKWNAMLSKSDKALQALEEMAKYDDPRVAEFLFKNVLKHRDVQVQLAAQKVVAQWKSKRTIGKLVELIGRERHKKGGFQRLRLLHKVAHHPKVKELVQDIFLRDNKPELLLTALEFVEQHRWASFKKYAQRIFRKYQKKNLTLAWKAVQALHALGEKYPKNFTPSSAPLPGFPFTSSGFALLTTAHRTLRDIVELPSQWKNTFKQYATNPPSAKVLLAHLLEKSLESVHPKTPLLIGTVSDTVDFWRKRPKPISQRDRKRILTFFKEASLGTEFDLYGALEKALANPKVDTLYIVVSTLPRGGYYNTAKETFAPLVKLLTKRYLTLHFLLLRIRPAKEASELEKAEWEEKQDKITKYYKKLAKACYGKLFTLEWMRYAPKRKTEKKKKKSFVIKKTKKGYIPPEEWRRVREEFERIVSSPRDLEYALEVVRKVAAADDERAAKLIIRKIFLQEKGLPWIWAALEGLKQCQKKSTLLYLAETLRRKRNRQLRIYLLYTLANSRFEKSEVEKVVLSFLTPKDPALCRLALNALKSQASPRALPRLRSLLRSKQRLLGYLAADIIEKITGTRPKGFPKESQEFLPFHPASGQIIFALGLSPRMKDKVKVPKELYQKITGKKWTSNTSPTLSKIKIALYYLKESIRHLPSHTRFTIAAVTFRTKWFQKKLVPAKQLNKKKALRFLENLSSGSENNLEEFFQQAARLDADTIYLITDALPSGGFEENPKKLLEKLTQRNWEKNLQIYHIRLFITTPPKKASKVAKVKGKKQAEKLREFYQELAKKNFGTFKEQVFSKASSLFD